MLRHKTNYIWIVSRWHVVFLARMEHVNGFFVHKSPHNKGSVLSASQLGRDAHLAIRSPRQTWTHVSQNEVLCPSDLEFGQSSSRRLTFAPHQAPRSEVASDKPGRPSLFRSTAHRCSPAEPRCSEEQQLAPTSLSVGEPVDVAVAGAQITQGRLLRRAERIVRFQSNMPAAT